MENNSKYRTESDNPKISRSTAGTDRHVIMCSKRAQMSSVIGMIESGQIRRGSK